MIPILMMTARVLTSMSNKKEEAIIKGDIVDLKVTYVNGERVVTEVKK
jgi:hypothetical protein